MERNFNSIKVRLEQSPEGFAGGVVNFNSIKVRLEQKEASKKMPFCQYFNSIKVRLEPHRE